MSSGCIRTPFWLWLCLFDVAFSFYATNNIRMFFLLANKTFEISWFKKSRLMFFSTNKNHCLHQGVITKTRGYGSIARLSPYIYKLIVIIHIIRFLKSLIFFLPKGRRSGCRTNTTKKRRGRGSSTSNWRGNRNTFHSFAFMN